MPRSKTRPVMIVLSIVAVLFMLGVLVGAPKIVKQSPFVFWGVFIIALIRLISWLFSPSEKSVDAQIAAGREITEKKAEISPGAATLCVYRRKGRVGWAVPVSVHCDKALIAILKNGSYAVCKVAPGQHVFSGAGPAKPWQIDMTLGVGEECFLAAGGTGLRFFFERVSKEKAEPEISALQRMD